MLNMSENRRRGSISPRLPNDDDFDLQEYMNRMEDLFKDTSECMVRMETTVKTTIENNTKTIDRMERTMGDSITKITLALISLIGGMIGKEFVPHSPIDVFAGVHNSFTIVSIFALLFAVFRLIQTRKVRIKSRKTYFLTLALIAMASLLIVDVVAPDELYHLLLSMPIGFVLVIFITLYAWYIDDIEQ